MGNNRKGDIKLMTQLRPVRFIGKITKMGEDYYIRIPTRMKESSAKLHESDVEIKVTLVNAWESESELKELLKKLEDSGEFENLFHLLWDRLKDEKQQVVKKNE